MATFGASGTVKQAATGGYTPAANEYAVISYQLVDSSLSPFGAVLSTVIYGPGQITVALIPTGANYFQAISGVVFST